MTSPTTSEEVDTTEESSTTAISEIPAMALEETSARDEARKKAAFRLLILSIGMVVVLLIQLLFIRMLRKEYRKQYEHYLRTFMRKTRDDKRPKMALKSSQEPMKTQVMSKMSGEGFLTPEKPSIMSGEGILPAENKTLKMSGEGIIPAENKTLKMSGEGVFSPENKPPKMSGEDILTPKNNVEQQGLSSFKWKVPLKSVGSDENVIDYYNGAHKTDQKPDQKPNP
nr:unnamed protein product [Haemonchus contortus]